MLSRSEVSLLRYNQRPFAAAAASAQGDNYLGKVFLYGSLEHTAALIHQAALAEYIERSVAWSTLIASASQVAPAI